MQQPETWEARVAAARQLIPGIAACSRWIRVTQRDTDLYTEAVHDADLVHRNVEWARANTPYGGTIAAGLWVTGMLIPMIRDTGVTARLEEALGVAFGLNYGFDSLRFIVPVPIGSLIRGRFENFDLVPRTASIVILRLDATVELEGKTRPALACKWRLAFSAPDASRSEAAWEAKED